MSVTPSNPKPISPLRARMIEDMTARNFAAGTQRQYIRAVKKLAGFIERSPDTATAEELRVLHTWGSAMTHHPHVHMIVPGGGLSPDGGRWIACRRGFLLPVLVLSKLFRRLMLRSLPPRIRQASSGSPASTRTLPARTRSRPSWRRSRRRSGSSIPSALSPDPKRCWPTSRAIRTGLPSRTGA